MKDAWHTKSWKDKCRLWLMPTGWRPADVAEKYPIFKIEDVYHFKKYDTTTSPAMKSWLWLQLIVLLLTIAWLFGHIADIGSPGMFVYGLFIFLFVYALAELMDNHPKAWLWEFLKLITGLAIIFYTSDWFGLNQVSPILNYVVVTYLLVSFAMSYWFCKAFEQWKTKIVS